jgi:very-short-patch-repair endonuclease
MQSNNRNKNKTSNSTPPFTMGAGGIQNRYLPYNKKLKKFSRNLRNESTLAEIVLWKELRDAKLGYTFNRQKPLLNYIVDFYCKPLNLVIKVDGISHWSEEQQKQDELRQYNLEELGLYFLRFDDSEVLYEIENVLATIYAQIEELEQKYPEAIKRRKNLPNPLKKGE